MNRFFSFMLTAMVIGGMVASCGGNKNNIEPGPGPENQDPDPIPEEITDYYVSVEGAGTKEGTSADNAMGLAELRALILQPMLETEKVDDDGNPVLDGDNPVIVRVQDDEVAFANAAKLDGKTIHFADGTYVLNGEEDGEIVPAKMEFHSYEKQVEVTFEGSRNAILSGNNVYRVLTIGNQVNLTLKGMTVKDGNLEEGNEDGAGITIAAGDSGDATLNAEGVLFSHIRNSSSKSGGAIRVGKGKFVAKDCVFDDTNYARNGASIISSNAKAVVECKSCTFSSGSYNTGGAVNNSGGSQHYEDCIFNACYTETGAGAAIHTNAEGSVVVAERCSFIGCLPRKNEATVASKPAGVISVQTSDVTLDGCLFENCVGGGAALVYLQSADCLFKCNNTVFRNNVGYDRGLIQTNASKSNDIASVAFFNNCLFLNNKLKTNQWGLILHGGTPGAGCFNNCTFYGNTRDEAGGNGVCLNTDGSIVLLNSTLIESDDLVSLRANNDDARNCFLVINSIVVNTSSGKPFIASDKLKPALCNSYNSIMGSTYSAPAQYKSNDDILDATLESIGGSFNENAKLFTWNGPGEGFTKMAAADFENALKTGASQRVTNKEHPYLGAKSLGTAFYEWLVSIDAIGKDAAGTARGSAWWPGAYQAN